MKIALMLCVMTATALAAPRYPRATRLDPTLAEPIRVAEQAWTTAAGEPDPMKAAALWEQAAAAFGAIDGAPVDAGIKRDAAYAALLAWKNALVVDARAKLPVTVDVDAEGPERPRPLPTREAKLITALDRFLAYAAAGDAEVPGVLLLKGQTLARHGHLAIAIPVLRTIVERHRTHETAEYAANLALDAYNRLGQEDQLVAFATELANDAALTRAHPELGAIARRIRQQAQRRHLERLERDASTSSRSLDPDAPEHLERYTAIGVGYLELYQAEPNAPGGDELLYNAGVAFRSSGAIVPAIEAFAMLQRTFPRSRLAERALARIGTMYGQIAQYDQAAAHLEAYGKKYAGEKDAVQAIRDAISYRIALGDRAKAIANIEHFIKAYGKKKPREAADAAWALVRLHQDAPAKALSSLQAYLRQHAAKGDPTLVVIAHAKIGELLWRQSCPHPLIDGLCVKENLRVARTCGTGTARVLTPTRRDPSKLKAALAAFALAIQHFERRPEAADAARDHYARARLAFADVEFEPFLALTFPSGLHFDPSSPRYADSARRVAEFVAAKQRDGSKLSRLYSALPTIKDAATAITATSRLGQLSESFATATATGEIPRDVRTGPQAADKVQAYCTALTDLAEPLHQHAIQGFSICLARSTELGWFGESSAQCERALLRLAPDQFPALNEHRAAARFVAPVIATEPPLRR